MIFTNLTSEEVTCVHRLYQLLRKLKVIGVMSTTTVQTRLTESGRPIRYTLKFAGYDASMKGKNTFNELLDELSITREQIDSCIRQSE